MNRFDINDVAIYDVLALDTPALRNLWTGSEKSVASIGAALRLNQLNQDDLVENIVQRGQQITVAMGITGFRPEQFYAMQDIANIDITKTVLRTIKEILKETGLAEKILDLILEELLELIAEAVAIVAQATAMTVLNAIPVVGWVIAIVLKAAFSIADSVKGVVDARAAIEKAKQLCYSPGSSAELDYGDSRWAIDLMARQTDWSELFLPTVNPNAFGKLTEYGPSALSKMGGFTCCLSVLHDGRVIAPLGIGYGAGTQGNGRDNYWPGLNREALGLIPMCPEIGVHRAIDKAPGGVPVDIGQRMPETASVGMQTWSTMWSGGPTAFTVDGRTISNAWLEYLNRMKWDIETNFDHRCGKDEGKGPYWLHKNRVATIDWVMNSLGGPVPAETAPVKQWKEFGTYQDALLKRLTIAYVDGATCHPAWRTKVEAAQRDLLEHPTAICRLDPSSIANPAFRSAVDLRLSYLEDVCNALPTRQMPSLDKLATSGPSLETWDPSRAPPMPRPPSLSVPGGKVATRGGYRKTKARTSTGGQPGRLGASPAQQKLDEQKRLERRRRQGDDSNWTLITIGTLGVVGVGGYIWYRKRKR